MVKGTVMFILEEDKNRFFRDFRKKNKKVIAFKPISSFLD